MPLASILGYGLRPLTHLLGYSPLLSPRNAVLVGVRDVDLKERPAVKKSGLVVYTMRQVDERGLRAVMQEAIAIAGRDTVGFCVSFDMDFVDPTEAPGVGTPVKGGATYREAHLVMELIADARRMLSLEIVEINPVIDIANKTANLAVELALSALGKKIL
jgi:arginase